jgi:phage anti-repressor protein
MRGPKAINPGGLGAEPPESIWPVPIQTAAFDEGESSAVSARDLHEWLRAGQDFTSWIKLQITRARFLEQQDFEVLTTKSENLRGGRPRFDYLLTLAAAKHVAMMNEMPPGHTRIAWATGYGLIPPEGGIKLDLPSVARGLHP